MAPKLNDMATWTELIGHVQLRSFVDDEGHFWLEQKTSMVERSAFKVPFRLGGTIYDLTDKEAANPQAAIDNAEGFAQEVRDTLFGKQEHPADNNDEEVANVG